MKRPSHYNAARVLKEWAEMGKNLVPTQRQYPLEWGAVEEMIAAARPKMEFEAGRLRRLVLDSNRLLSPLADPLCTDFGTHRFLEPCNEMAYSDWLAWIVDQLGGAKVAFPLFGLEGMEPKSKIHTEVLRIKRESDIPRGRLDLCILRGKRPLAIVEVKLDTAEQADLRSLRLYKKWLEKELQRPASGRLVLLALDGDMAEYKGFRLLKWIELCVRLRRVSSRLVQERRVTLAAMILAFVGAVEQNLLKFPYDLIKRTLENKNQTLPSTIPDYLEESTEGRI